MYGITGRDRGSRQRAVALTWFIALSAVMCEPASVSFTSSSAMVSDLSDLADDERV